MYQFLVSDVGHAAPKCRKIQFTAHRAPGRAPRGTHRRTPTSGSRRASSRRPRARRPRDAAHLVAHLGQEGAAVRTTMPVIPPPSLAACRFDLLYRAHRLPSLVGLTGSGPRGSDTLLGSTSCAGCQPNARVPEPESRVQVSWQVRRDSNPQPSVLETDALPIELLTCKHGFQFSVFGLQCAELLRNVPEPETEDRRTLLRFLVRRVLPAEPAVLAELQPLRRLLLVLRRAVVPALAVAARQMNDVSHC